MTKSCRGERWSSILKMRIDDDCQMVEPPFNVAQAFVNEAQTAVFVFVDRDVVGPKTHLQLPTADRLDEHALGLLQAGSAVDAEAQELAAIFEQETAIERVEL